MDDWEIAAWNADYYDIVEHSFWAPGSMGRTPKQNVKPREVLRSLRRNEDPLNHVLMMFFRLAPKDFTRTLFDRWCLETATPEFQIQNRYQIDALLGVGFTQPDLFFVHPDISFMIEMKVDAKSSADQVLKYVVLSHLESKRHGTTKPMRLCYLGKCGVEAIFKGSPSSPNEIMDRVQKLNRAEYRQRWKFLDDADWAAIDARLASMKLIFKTYQDLDLLLTEYEANLKSDSPYADTVAELFKGVRGELRCRRLVHGLVE